MRELAPLVAPPSIADLLAQGREVYVSEFAADDEEVAMTSQLPPGPRIPSALQTLGWWTRYVTPESPANRT